MNELFESMETGIREKGEAQLNSMLNMFIYDREDDDWELEDKNKFENILDNIA